MHLQKRRKTTISFFDEKRCYINEIENIPHINESKSEKKGRNKDCLLLQTVDEACTLKTLINLR